MEFTEKAVAALDFIKGLELITGGIRGWKGAPAYPEVSGYLIPTLLDYGERELAVRLADWLVSIQNDDGSFCDMYGQKRSFDTAAVMEGLFQASGQDLVITNETYWNAAARAGNWLHRMVRDDGAVRTMPESSQTHLYIMRVSGLIDSHPGAEYWMKQHWTELRMHYIAYALEGLWKMGEQEFVRNKLTSIEGLNGFNWDLCAKAQMAILYQNAGMDPMDFVEAVESHGSELPDSWTAKWILDMWKVVGET